MCLELFNPFLGLPFTWLGLGLFAGIIAFFAVRCLFPSSSKDTTHRQSSGFTCPCYVSPVKSQENK